MENTQEQLSAFRAALQSPELHHVEQRSVAGRILLVAMSGPNRWNQIAGAFASPEAEQILAEAGLEAECSDLINR